MRFLLIALLAISFWSCEKASVYEANMDLRNQTWVADSVLSFNFNVVDPSVPHNVGLIIRNTSDYPFYNLYIVYHLKDSSGNQISTDLADFHLFEAKTGRPLGSGIGGIFNHKFSLINGINFEKPGGYQLEIEQNMRLDLLPGIISVGVEVANNK